MAALLKYSMQQRNNNVTKAFMAHNLILKLNNEICLRQNNKTCYRFNKHEIYVC